MKAHRSGRVGALVAAFMLVVVAACSSAAGGATGSPSAVPSPAGPPHGVGGTATAGPVCPVERVPPDIGCEPRPVIGAVITVRDASGSEVGRTTTGPDGTYFIELPAGSYVVVPAPATGLMRAPGPAPVTIGGGVTVLDLSYDTGIR
jgi:hypothetical protein